ncbi:DUF5995 family protein [Krasilnikovia sp. M28-CT-15]|uniref:DUF5995 family protein n=1 Tax=Krasilnikovia sp. M28-CT-15 TaxID=3373540 RepID=UPI00387710FC
MTEGSIRALLDRMRAELATLGGAQRYFHSVYLRTTEAVAAEIERGGFADGDWVRRWDLAFATLYLDALDADRAGRPVTQPWQVAFTAARDRPDLPPLQHVLLGLNAHINFDLPQALIAVISPDDFDDAAILARRDADHRHVDVVLQARVSAEARELGAVSRVGLLDRLLRPANRAASRRFLAEARAKVWHNTRVLDQARRARTYDTVLAELERLCADRVRDLVAPGPVLLKLARRGFGVRLPR